MCFHIDALTCEMNSLHLQQPSLQQCSISDRKGIHKNLSAGADHALPGQTFRTAMHCPSHLACHVGRSYQRGDLAVR